MNEELLSYSSKRSAHIQPDLPEEEVASKSPKGSGKLSTIFLVVLGLHIIVIVGVSAFHLLRGQASHEVATTSQEAVEMPKIEEVTKTESTPVSPVISEPVVSTSQQHNVTPSVASAPTAWVSQNASEPTHEAPMVSESVSQKEVKTAGEIYVVVKGDSLTKIARKNDVSLKQLRKLNGLNSDVIRLGQKLKLPGESIKAQSVAAKSVSNKSEYYQVSKGDTLMKIARKYNTTASKLAALNKINDPAKIHIGTKLKVPMESSHSLEAGNLSPQAKPFRAPVQNTDLAMLREPENT